MRKKKVLAALETALLTAAKKRFGQGDNIQVDIDTDTGEISIVSKKTIAENVVDAKTEISLEEARKIDDEAEMGDEIGSLIDMEDFGRIAAQAAKQVICQKVSRGRMGIHRTRIFKKRRRACAWGDSWARAAQLSG